MPWKKLLWSVRDILNYCAVAFLLADGLHTAFPGRPGLTLISQPRWIGYWMVLSAVAVAARLRAARTNPSSGAI